MKKTFDCVGCKMAALLEINLKCGVIVNEGDEFNVLSQDDNEVTLNSPTQSFRVTWFEFGRFFGSC